MASSLTSVQRRSAEFGIRMALSAAPSLLLTTVIRQGMLPVALGVTVGTAVALLASRALSGFLFEVQPTDPVSVLVAASALLTAGMLAALVPAMRASSAAPAAALRAEKCATAAGRTPGVKCDGYVSDCTYRGLFSYD